ncbi:MAG: sialate O-acetylesterase [Phycisphaerae bacterium]|jgi:sialate O-acetylesterase|nr:sialate O-acetylesterase [Phycisphaerae bacterium]
MRKTTILLAIVLLASTGVASGGVRLPAFFGDNMVLQRNKPVSVWGRAGGGDRVTVKFAGQSKVVAAMWDGTWRVTLDPMKACAEDREMTVSSNIPGDSITIANVLVGDVWFCSGQSNMEKPVNKQPGQHPVNNYREVLDKSKNRLIRHIKVKPVKSWEPVDDVSGGWVAASPETTGKFTAVGYFFAREIHKHRGVPVGLINSTLGGTHIGAWMSLESMNLKPDELKQVLGDMERAKNYPKAHAAYVAEMKKWRTRHKRLDPRPNDASAAPGLNIDDWKDVKLPGTWKDLGLPAHSVVWLRKEFSIPSKYKGRVVRFDIGPLSDSCRLYLNGKSIGSSGQNNGKGDSVTRPFYFRPETEKNVFALRIASNLTPGQLLVQRDNMRIVDHKTRQSLADLKGVWKAKVTHRYKALAPGSEAPPTPPSRRWRIPGGPLFNGMINPLVGYGVAGFLWYQGESSLGVGMKYQAMLRQMTGDWRMRWGDQTLPFYYCQLANFHDLQKTPDERSGWAVNREAMRRALADIKHSGMAVLIDIGEARDIHPVNKQDVGRRLALIARAKTYGEKIEYSGPMYESMKIEGGAIRLKFSHVGKGLVARKLPAKYHPKSYDRKWTIPLPIRSPGSRLQGFVISGADGKWKWASAKIENDTVLVSSPDVPKPAAVRYAWADNPVCNLYNKAGLPASPFTTENPQR